MALVLAVPARAQVGRFDVAISSAPSPVGAGARAAGVAGAFIALADDATAASWNPGGLVQLERPEASAVALGAFQSDRVPDRATEDEDGYRLDRVFDGDAASGRLNYLSAALPFAWATRNAVVSLNYQQTFAFDRGFSLYHEETTSDSRQTSSTRFEQEGALYAVSPAFAVELTPELSIGSAVNFWLDGVGRSTAWSSRSEYITTLEFDGTRESHSTVYTRNDLFRGTNATFGVLWKATTSARLGAVVKLPFEASFRSVTDGYTDGVLGAERRARLRMHLPLQFGLGGALAPSDAVRISLDVTHVRWGDFRLSDGDSNEYLISGDPVSTSNPLYPPDGPPGGYHVDAVTTVRAGAEYLYRVEPLALAFRLGLLYDPEPSRGVPEDAYGGAAGFGVSWGSASFDLAYQIRVARQVDGVAVLRNLLSQPRNTIDFEQHDVYGSVIVYF
ncbi:MAG: outer membrane protein transport protein [Deltaproteobacteria bacterium]|nr:outer membrane protein transport protein [Deltaproteobacteria bacterium]